MIFCDQMKRKGPTGVYTEEEDGQDDDYYFIEREVKEKERKTRNDFRGDSRRETSDGPVALLNTAIPLGRLKATPSYEETEHLRKSKNPASQKSLPSVFYKKDNGTAKWTSD